MATLKVTNIKNESFAGDQLYLKTDGKIGIGTTSPANEFVISKSGAAANCKLEIVQSGGGGGTSEILFSDAVSGRGRIFYDHGSNPEGIKLEAAGTQTLIATTAGRVGIGTIAPDHKLHIQDGTTPRLVVEDTTNNVQAQIGADNTEARIGTASNHPVSFRINDSEKLRLTSDGDFGIGTGDAWARLVVHESSTNTSLTGHNYLASQSGMSIENGSNTTGSFNAYTTRVKNAGGTQQSASLAFKSTSSGYSPEIHLTQRTGAGAQATRLLINSDGDIEVGGNLKTNNLSGRNLVINGAMKVSQRGTSFSGSATPEYTLDRFKQANGSGWNFDTTTTQESAGPDGFSKSLKITPDTTDTPTGGENGVIDYFIEGQDLQHLAFGTSSAKKVTVSFYARSSAQNNNHQYTLQMWHKNSGTSQFNINKAFTVTSTWQRFIITFPADTSNNMLDGSGEWAGRLTWILSSGPDDIASEVSTWTSGNLYKAVTGQSNFMDNTSNQFHLTGVQLEVGSIATDFEHRSYNDELARCQRYYWQIDEGGYVILPKNGYYESHSYPYPVKMRANPGITSNNSWVIRALNSGSNLSYSGLNTHIYSTRFYMSSTTTNNSDFHMFIIGADSNNPLKFSADF